MGLRLTLIVIVTGFGALLFFVGDFLRRRVAARDAREEALRAAEAEPQSTETGDR